MTYTIKHKQTGCELLKYDEKSDLYGAKLIGADLRGADLSGADLTNAKLRGADLTNANLTRGADLSDADLSGADLRGADLTGADLTNADLTDATLSGANLTKANLRQVWVCVGTRLHQQPDIIDLGTDNRGYRFWAWHDTALGRRVLENTSGKVVYRAGCREWFSHESAIAHYAEDTYTGNGDRAECIRRMHVIRGWAMQWI